MESDVVRQVAADVVRDHFGEVVERVANVLMCRGALSLREVVRFVRQDVGSFVEEHPLSLPEVRNALMTLVQHGVVSFKPHPKAIAVDSGRGVPQIYSINMFETLSRSRFPHFLEHVRVAYSDVAYKLLYTVLRHGRVVAGVALAETMRLVGGTVTAGELESELRKLCEAGIVRTVGPCSCSLAATPPAESVTPLATEGDLASAPPPCVTSVDSLQRPSHGGDVCTSGAQKRKRQESVVPAEGGVKGAELVYRYCPRALSLCLLKNSLTRLMEERVSATTAQVLSALLTNVKPGESGAAKVEYMQFAEIEATMTKLGYHPPGRDPARTRERLRKVLDFLSAHTDGMLKKRAKAVLMGKAGASRSVPPLVDDDEPKGRGMEQEARVPVVQDEAIEWAVDWKGACLVLKNAVMSSLVRDQFGPLGLRIFNYLSERDVPQKVEEKDIFSNCMVPASEGREILNTMARRSVISWQEVPRASSGPPLVGSWWLYHVDRKQVEQVMVMLVFKTILNLRVRFRAENAKMWALESRAASLTAEERSKLLSGRRTEDILERSFLKLDGVVLAFSAF